MLFVNWRYWMASIPMLILVLVVSAGFGYDAVRAEDHRTIVEQWREVQPPVPVQLQAVALEAATTAFLVLDIEARTCNAERRPRCVASVPGIEMFLTKAREAGVAIIYSLTSKGTPETILPGVVPVGGEPVVRSSVDKFYQTDLEDILRSRGIKTVVIAGTTAEGAVLHTATGASMRGYQVVVPVDGISAGSLYAEQYTAWHMLNAPGTRKRTILSQFDMITFH